MSTSTPPPLPPPLPADPPSADTADTAGTAERGRRLPADDRREQLLACATRLFGERPYTQVSTTEIAREAGIARGLLNHYFGDKRRLYLEVVRRAALLPPIRADELPTGTLAQRVDASVRWFLDSVEPYRTTFLTVRGAEGVGEDTEVLALIDRTDDIAAQRVLQMVGLDPEQATARAAVRAFGGLARGTVREWTRGGALTRDQAHLLLRASLLAIVRDVLPALAPEPT